MKTRELTRSERAAIRRLVPGLCANYDRLYKVCLPLDCECPMLKQWWTTPLCRYFQSAVLPLDSKLHTSILGAGEDLHRCRDCGKLFRAASKNILYCKPCATERTRCKKREWAQKNRVECRKSTRKKA